LDQDFQAQQPKRDTLFSWFGNFTNKEGLVLTHRKFAKKLLEEFG